MIIMPQIRPITDLRNTNDISELCHSSMEPIFITKNGYGDLVVMSMDKYDELIRKAELYEKLELAEQQMEKGELLDGDAVFEELTKKYGKKV